MASIVETAPLVLDVGVVLTVAANMGFTARKLGLPSVIGYLLTGLLVSPFTPGFVADSNQLSLLADIGVVLLLFEVGIDIDLRRIGREQKALLWGAPTQVAIGLAIGTPVFLSLSIPLLGALLLALSIALSSSVVIVNITRSPRRTTNTATEEALLGWSVVQDLFAVLFFVVIGSLIEPAQLTKAWPFALLMILLLIFLKTLPIALFARIGKLKVKKSQFAIGMSQIGEFSLVLGSLAYSEDALTRSQFTGVLMAVVISINGSTLLARRVPA